MQVSKDAMKFLKDLSKNNNRDWFNERKKTFKGHEAEVKEVYQAIMDELSKHDDVEKFKIMRIYRDVRFSKDKTPFNPRFAGGFSRATKALRGGYWLNIQPGQSCAGGGFYGPEKNDLFRIRKEFEMDDEPIRKILANKNFQKTFPNGLQGEELKSAPRDFSADHKAIDLIRKKQFYVMREFTDAEVCSPGFVKEVVKTFNTVRPYFDYMSEVLTTDLNGVSTI
mgnify:FL=1